MTNHSPLKQNKTRKSRGIQLLDFAVAAILIGLAAAAIVLMMSKAAGNRKTTQTIQDLASIQGAIQSLYAQQPTYTGLTNTILINTNNVPSRMVGTPVGTLNHPFGGGVVVTGSGSSYTIQLLDIPSDACPTIASSDFGRGMVSFALAEASGTPITAQSTPASVAQTAVSCRSNTGIDSMTWVFR
jgi:type II secretory pathway pseudopilin PulG